MNVKALLEEMERGLEGVTPGPWKTHMVDDTTVMGADGTEVGTTCDSRYSEREDGYNIEYERMEADAAHIARCSPDNMRAILAYVRELEAERDRCHARLEIDHCFKLSEDESDEMVRVDIPLEQRTGIPDGIECREETVRQQDKLIGDLDTNAGLWKEAAYAWKERAEKAEGESLEQDRLIGIGAERELALVARAEAAEAECKRLRGLLWYGWYEMNAIRAESGVPCGYDGTRKSIDEQYWSDIVDAMSDALGDDAAPWASNDARAVADAIRAALEASHD